METGFKTRKSRGIGFQNILLPDMPIFLVTNFLAFHSPHSYAGPRLVEVKSYLVQTQLHI